MKGIVFTEFFDTVDDAFGEDMTDRLLDKCPVASGGNYTAVGTYDAGELHQLVGALSSETRITPESLQRIYGRRLFGRFFELYPSLFEGVNCPFALLASVEHNIHAEVRKLYPDAELPSILPLRQDKTGMTLRYRSPRRLEAFCGGLIDGCLEHFGVTATVTMTQHEDEQGVYHDFQIRLSEGAR